MHLRETGHGKYFSFKRCLCKRNHAFAITTNGAAILNLRIANTLTSYVLRDLRFFEAVATTVHRETAQDHNIKAHCQTDQCGLTCASSARRKSSVPPISNTRKIALWSFTDHCPIGMNSNRLCVRKCVFSRVKKL